LSERTEDVDNCVGGKRENGSDARVMALEDGEIELFVGTNRWRWRSG
jgi:hypothetical protein